jgi:hypothetical protein
VEDSAEVEGWFMAAREESCGMLLVLGGTLLVCCGGGS